MGLGKTAIALTYIHKHLKRGDARDALVVCPASLVASWEQAIEDMIKFEGFDSHAVKLLKERVTIRSFQKMYWTEMVYAGMSNGKKKHKRIWHIRDDIYKRWSIFVVDEAHQCSAHDGAQYNVATTLAKLSSRRYLLTGTPVHGGKGRSAYDKLFGEVQIMTAGQEFRTWTEFCNKAVLAWDEWHKPAAFNENFCRKLMEDHAIVLRVEDCMDMPDKMEQDVPCALVEKTIYNDLKTGKVDKYGIDITNAGAQYTKMLQVCSGSIKVSETKTMVLKTSKDDALGDILNGTDEPVVVFCNYRASIDHAAKVAKNAKRKVVVYDGRSKTETWKDFQSGKADCIVCQYQSGGSGLNLQRAHIMCLYEPCFSSLLLTQAQARIYRKGQEHTCQYYYLSTPSTLEAKVFKMVRKGIDVNDKLLEQLARGEQIA
jgi:SNF2 family DNA or RNA helicase